MCTVTYIPQGPEGFILTSNRDEQPSRSTQGIVREDYFGQQLLFPRDSGAGGTWIAASSHNRLICLLNGAFERHDRTPPYRMSRGIMVLEFFQQANVRDFIRKYDFSDIEPFTLVIVDKGQLWEVRWNGETLFPRDIDPSQMHIWSSATLYDQQMRAKREQWFAEWQSRHAAIQLRHILDFHQNAGEGDPWVDVVMNREGIVRTVSITSVAKRRDSMDMFYSDLLSSQVDEAKIQIQREVVEPK